MLFSVGSIVYREELMIDNIVFNALRMRPERIHELGSGLVMLDDDMLCEYDEIEPVDLTEEILVKSGFQDSHIGDLTAFKSPDGRLELHHDERYINSGNKWNVHVDDKSMCTIGSLELSYVHELQNFLTLCKYNLDIVV